MNLHFCARHLELVVSMHWALYGLRAEVYAVPSFWFEWRNEVFAYKFINIVSFLYFYSPQIGRNTHSLRYSRFIVTFVSKSVTSIHTFESFTCAARLACMRCEVF